MYLYSFCAQTRQITPSVGEGCRRLPQPAASPKPTSITTLVSRFVAPQSQGNTLPARRQLPHRKPPKQRSSTISTPIHVPMAILSNATPGIGSSANQVCTHSMSVWVGTNGNLRAVCSVCQSYPTSSLQAISSRNMPETRQVLRSIFISVTFGLMVRMGALVTLATCEWVTTRSTVQTGGC